MGVPRMGKRLSVASFVVVALVASACATNDTSRGQPATSGSDTTIGPPPSVSTDTPAGSAVRVIDDRSRNPASWSGDYGLPDDALVPLDVVYEPGGGLVIAYWVGLEDSDLGSLPAEVAEQIGWGSIRLAGCADRECADPVEISDDVFSSIWPDGGGDSVDIGVLTDGSVVMSIGEIWVPRVEWEPDQMTPPPGRRLLVVCDSVECAAPLVKDFNVIIGDPLEARERPQLDVSATGHLVLAYRTGPLESEQLRIAVCADSTCSSFTSVVDIDQPVLGYELFIDGLGRPGVLYQRWDEEPTRLAVCARADCVGAVDRVVLVDRAGNATPLVGPGDALAFWFVPYEPTESFPDEPIEPLLIECEDMGCQDARVIAALDQFPTVPTNATFSDPICGQHVAFSPEGLLTISWCQNEAWERHVVVCDEPACHTGTDISVPDNASGLFTHVRHTSIGEPVLIFGGTNGLRIVNITRLDK